MKKKRDTQPLPDLHILDTPKPLLKVRVAQPSDVWETKRAALSESERVALEKIEQEWGWDRPEVSDGKTGRKPRPSGYDEALENFVKRFEVPPRGFDRNKINYLRRKGLLP